MLKARIHNDKIRLGRHFGLSFQRTLRIPDDGGTYPLPPGIGRFPIRRVRDYGDRVPNSWRRRGGVFLPIYQREAMWLCFDPPPWRPCALQVAVGKVNAISGERWSGRLTSDPQNYLVCPDQPWLDGINAGEGFIRQFVAMPLGLGYTVEGQITGREEEGGVQVKVFEPRPGRFPDQPPAWDPEMLGDAMVCCAPTAEMEMGLGAGGRMRQKIYPDEYGIDTWDPLNTGRVFVHLANSMMWREITGEEPPATPVSPRTYAQYGLPWFDLYDEDKSDIKAPAALRGVRSVKEIDASRGFGPLQDDAAVDLGKCPILKIVEAPAAAVDSLEG